MTKQEYAKELAKLLKRTGETVEIIDTAEEVAVNLPISIDDKQIGEESINVDSFYDNTPVSELAEMVLEHYKLVLLSESDKSFENTKDRIIYELANKDKIRNYLSMIPYIELSEDIVLIFKLYLSDKNDPKNYAIRLLDNETVNNWNKKLSEPMNEKKLFEYASVNTPIFQKAIFIPLPANEHYPFNAICTTNENTKFGAAVILYPGVLKTLANGLDDDLLIIPINIHEIQILPYKEGRFFIKPLTEALKEMYKDDDKLSKDIFVYSKEKATIKRIEE